MFHNIIEMIDTISLFTGAGGFDLGFESTGKYKTKCAIELVPEYFESINSNKGKVFYTHPFLCDSKLINKDVKEVDFDAFAYGRRSHLVLYGGPPCQSFSTIGKRAGLDDPRGSLIFDFVKIVDKVRPDVFVFENVPNIGIQWNGKVLDMLLSMFHSVGYKTVHGVLNAADYGAYTRRKRLIVIGTHQKDILLSLPLPTHCEDTNKMPLLTENLLQWNGVGGVLDKMPLPSPQSEFSNHVAVRHTEPVIKRFSQLKYGEQDKIRKRWRLDPSQPAPSLMAGGNEGYAFHIHYKYPRELTARECARIQGFPDQYHFNGKPREVAKQIVNAVPVQLAAAIGNHIATFFSV